MPVIELFGGLVPRLSKHKLSADAATVAHDVKLRSGKLEAWREKKELHSGLIGAVSFDYYDCCPLVWDTCVSATNYMPEFERLYLSGRSDHPEQAYVFDDCSMSYFYLGVPAPDMAPTVSGTESCGETTSVRSYIYTYVNEDGEESGPSPASPILSIADGAPVRVTVYPPLTGYRIAAINIYRAGTGYRLGNEKEQSPITDFMLVETVTVGASSITITDSLGEDHLGPICESRENRVPPQDLRFLRHINGTGTLVGATQTGVHFSRNMQPWNWPAEFDLIMPHNIVHLVTWDKWVYVTTDSSPQIINGGVLESRADRQVIDLGVSLPDISCGYANSAVGTPFGAVYASVDGLILVKPNGQFDVITAGWYSTDDWKRLRPDTVRLAYWRGYIICVTDVVSFLLELDGKTYADYSPGALVTISDKPVDMRVTDSGELLMLENDSLWQWDAGSKLRPYKWESRELSWGGKSSPTMAKVRTTDITFKLLTPWPDVFYERHIVDEKPVRLGRVGRHLNYRLGFYGTGTVEFAQLGTAEITVNKGA